MLMNPIASEIEQKYCELFQETPLIIRSPGRVNLIGEHTDYNEGFVLPAAIDKAIYFAITARDDEICSLYASDLKESYEFHLKEIRKSELGWSNYLLGVVDQILKLGYTIKGFNCVFGGDIPIGAGLSSSAALEAGLAYGLNEINQLHINPMELVKLSQRAENEFVGVQCGIMDQMINIFGRENQVLQLDCRSLEYRYFPFESERIKIVLCDSQVQRELWSSEYNLRRSQCEKGVEILQKFYPEVISLRDVSLEQLVAHRNFFDTIVFNRCKYVIEENQRVLDGCQDLSEGNFEGFGQKMYQSHTGLTEEYEVSCEELDFLVDAASKQPGVIGARMMGAGFGGCTINLVWADQLERFEHAMTEEFIQRMNKDAKIYITEITTGAAIYKEKIMNL